MTDARADDRLLLGTWSLVSAEFAGAPAPEIYCNSPEGYLVLTDAGRLMAIIQSPEGLMSYTGSFNLLDGNRFVTRVDLAWIPDWVGSDQLRFWHFEGELLALETDERAHTSDPRRVGRYKLLWRRLSAVREQGTG